MVGVKVGVGVGVEVGELRVRRAPTFTRHALAFLAGVRSQWTLCQHAGFATARSQGPIGSLGNKVGDAL
eukprot:scaffold3810_cov64-Phaeocystis_antarctica.AAC.4